MHSIQSASVFNLIRRPCRAFTVLLLWSLALLPTDALAREPMPSAEQAFVSHVVPITKDSTTLVPSAMGDPLPRIQCPAGYTATLYAEGLSSPDGLALSPAGVLYVAEETAGRISRIESNGSITPILSGLHHPEGIAFDNIGNLYVVEDVPDPPDTSRGRLLKVATDGITTTLATDLDAPEGVFWAADGTLYITESNVQFTSNPVDFRTRVTAISPLNEVTRILTDTLFWSYGGITIGPDGLLYVTNEVSGVGNPSTQNLDNPTAGHLRRRSHAPSFFAVTEGYDPEGD
jgi:sugar lactone lactonase YvrE